MDNLYDITNNDKYDETTKLKISYQVLNGAAKYKEFRPTVKHYLTSQIRSKLLYINPVEWDIALWLDTARFEKASKTEVWKESRRIIKGK
jgi:hypothetical protein